MTTITRFEDLVVWQKAMELGLLVYAKTKDLRDYAFVDQIRRASISIINNIAEGFERRSLKEKIQFFTIARGSDSEVRAMIIFGGKLGYFTSEDEAAMHTLALEIVKMLTSLMNKMEH